MNKNKILGVSFVVLFIAMGMVGFAKDDVKVRINGNYLLNCEVPAQIIDGRTMLPLRSVFEAIGVTVDYDSVTHKITATDGERVVCLTIGSNVMTINGEAKELDVPVKLVNNRTLVPLRACAESFDMTVGWDENTRTVDVNKEEKRLWCVDKPIIYLYPTEEIELLVKLGNTEKIKCSYPKYTTGWKVLAKPNGDLTDIVTGRNLYSLYYESNNVVDFKVEKDGFVVKGSNTAKFLEEKLAILGLSEREAEEFIVYWLPKLEVNEYNYIRFATIDEINENMPLEINPNPDTIIRVLMTYKGLENPIDVQEQQLITLNRAGFVVVEWGGTEIK